MFSSCFGVTHPLKRVSNEVSRKGLIDIPVAVDPTLMLMNSDLGSLAKLTLHDLDTIVLTVRGLATGAVVRADFCKGVSDDMILVSSVKRGEYQDDRALREEYLARREEAQDKSIVLRKAPRSGDGEDGTIYQQFKENKHNESSRIVAGGCKEKVVSQGRDSEAKADAQRVETRETRRSSP